MLAMQAEQPFDSRFTTKTEGALHRDDDSRSSAVRLGEHDYEKDCKNNKNLSYSKMLYETNLRHVRQVIKDPSSETGYTYQKFSVCNTSTGWFCRRNRGIVKRSDEKEPQDNGS